MIFRAVLSLCILLLAPTSLSAEDLGSLLRENDMLQVELNLARKKNIYFVFNLQEQSIYLKAMGTVYKEYPILSFLYRGKPSGLEATILMDKSDIQKRKKIIPKKEGQEDETFTLEALELDDMPKRFVIAFENGLNVTVVGHSKGFTGSVLKSALSLKWRLFYPVLATWHSIRSKPFSAMLITLDSNDARSLYWSMRPGTKSVVFLPAEATGPPQ